MNTNPIPLVSVLMTAYNREKYIGEAIESVLASTYQNWELIIVDDYSIDRTVEIAKEYAQKDARIKVYVNESNLGDYPNRNKAASYAKGKYIKYLDSDDIIYDFGLDVMVRYMQFFPEAGYGLCCLSYEEPVPVCISPRQVYLENFESSNHFGRSPGSSIINLEHFKILGGFSGARMIGDYEFWFKIGRYYPMVKLPYDLHWCRPHDGREGNSEYSKKYPVLRKKVIENALKHPDCPLSILELKKIKKRLISLQRKDKLIRFLLKVKNTFI